MNRCLFREVDFFAPYNKLPPYNFFAVFLITILQCNCIHNTGGLLSDLCPNYFSLRAYTQLNYFIFPFQFINTSDGTKVDVLQEHHTDERHLGWLILNKIYPDLDNYPVFAPQRSVSPERIVLAAVVDQVKGEFCLAFPDTLYCN